MSELKPCPFCGGKAHIWNSGYFYNGKCYKCGCTLSGNGYVTEAEAIDAWNNRTACKNCAALNKAAGLWAKADKRARDLERTCHNTQSDFDFMCSICGKMLDNGRIIGVNYCPNCGAKVVSE